MNCWTTRSLRRRLKAKTSNEIQLILLSDEPHRLLSEPLFFFVVTVIQEGPYLRRATAGFSIIATQACRAAADAAVAKATTSANARDQKASGVRSV